MASSPLVQRFEVTRWSSSGLSKCIYGSEFAGRPPLEFKRLSKCICGSEFAGRLDFNQYTEGGSLAPMRRLDFNQPTEGESLLRALLEVQSAQT
jgi:hypothetical protein